MYKVARMMFLGGVGVLVALLACPVHAAAPGAFNGEVRIGVSVSTTGGFSA